MVEAINTALREAMAEDERVVVFGQDVVRQGGVFRVTEGLAEECGPQRCFDTPLAESAIVGVALGCLFRIPPQPAEPAHRPSRALLLLQACGRGARSRLATDRDVAGLIRVRTLSPKDRRHHGPSPHPRARGTAPHRRRVRPGRGGPEDRGPVRAP
ncbi:hypothetical protein ACIF8T_15295 [Streptomyces sp. NPDC085946]|uniref:hypothetical protein n=1 Tax=Streptomyces sp. NPDC085946 TaxID=3365744 RepID=UPI0037D16766